jgi:hypothetical protein
MYVDASPFVEMRLPNLIRCWSDIADGAIVLPAAEPSDFNFKPLTEVKIARSLLIESP